MRETRLALGCGFGHETDAVQARLLGRADQAAAYGRVAELMAALQSQGWQHLDLVLRPSAKP